MLSAANALLSGALVKLNDALMDVEGREAIVLGG